MSAHRTLVASLLIMLAGTVGCAHAPRGSLPAPETGREWRGTAEPFAAHAIYFVLTDRFVNGDPSNDHRDQGGGNRTFDLPLAECDGVAGNIGYLGGDFRGLLDNAGYIRDMGFGAVWITPIVDNPDEAFTGGDEISCTSFLSDRGKAGYHGYWGTNFHVLDEHLPSDGLDFAGLAAGLHAAGLKTVLDIVANHGSPAWSMPVRQPGFGQVFVADGRLVADHQNLHPSQLDPANEPLHRFWSTKPDLAQLGDFDPGNPQVLDHLAGAYLQWIDQGADAFRVDTIRHMPLDFWKRFSDRIRADHPGFFMFAEAFDHQAANIAPFTWPENGGIGVLDFPLKQAMAEVFGRNGGGFERIGERLYLADGPYQNPYELMTFYDNHDMARLDADDQGFIDAHNFLFTARGIPVLYYGSETGFMRGHVEHAGNRNYFGQERIDAAPTHPIHQALARIARVRRDNPALQRGLQVNLEMSGDRAAFYRVVQHGDDRQIALVLLNKGDAPARFEIDALLEPGSWQSTIGGSQATVGGGGSLSATVPAHGVDVWLHGGPVTRADLAAALDAAAAGAQRARQAPE